MNRIAAFALGLVMLVVTGGEHALALGNDLFDEASTFVQSEATDGQSLEACCLKDEAPSRNASGPCKADCPGLLPLGNLPVLESPAALHIVRQAHRLPYSTDGPRRPPRTIIR